MNSFLHKKLIQPLLAFLQQGVSPSKLAWAVGLGIVIATIPVFGASTLLCLLAICLLRLNPAAVLLVNQFAYPLQFVLYLPLIRGGEWLFHQPPMPFSISQIFQLFRHDLLQAMGILWWATIHALVVWLLLCLPLTWLLYSVLRRIFVKIRRTTIPPSLL